MADEMLLAGQRVEPQKMMQHGFEFCYPYLAPALHHELRDGAPSS
jgi:NAD dependent epimerase/dehydratase family enzyme